MSARRYAWPAWVVLAFLILPWINGPWYGVVVPASAAALALVLRMAGGPGVPLTGRRRGRRADLLAVLVLYAAVVGLLSLAFRVFTTAHIPGLFLSFAATLLTGVLGPILWTVRVRGGSLHDLGLRTGNLGETARWALVFALAQAVVTIRGLDLPRPEGWVPLLVMALTVGVFESVFFRGFVQTRLVSQFGPVAGTAGAAVLYGLYHVGYGMGGGDLLFLTGLGVVYAVAFGVVRNVLVLWPLLTPLGSFFANVRAGDIDLPWASIAGFADVLVVMVGALVVAVRFEHRRAQARAQAQARARAQSGRMAAWPNPPAAPERSSGSR